MVDWTTIGIIAAVLTLFLSVMQWMISRANKKGAINQKIDDAHERMRAYDSKSVECEKRFVQLEERKTDNRAFEEIKLDLEIIKRSIGPHNQLFVAQSPIKLTDLGRQVALEAGIIRGVESNWPNILPLLDKAITSSNPYDIQQVCFGIAIGDLESILLPEDLEKLKTYAFNTGNSVLYYGRVVGIVIRDRYFAEKGIDIAEIDKHDPAKQ